MNRQHSISWEAYARRIDNLIFSSLKDHFIRALERECLDDCESLLDIGCGSHSPLQRFSKKMKYTVGVDAFEPAIEDSKKLEIHSDYKLMDWRRLTEEFDDKSFDCVCALDFIEHLSKNDGLELISFMEAVARKKVIISTPNGFLPQGVYYGNPLQIHLSGWDPDEMAKMGYRVIGINGWKRLKGEVGGIKWRPRLFWSRVSLLSQPLMTRRPSMAFGILCIKNLC